MKVIFVLYLIMSFCLNGMTQIRCDFAEMKVISEVKKENQHDVSKLFETSDGQWVLLLYREDKLTLQKLDEDFNVRIEKEYTIKMDGGKTLILDVIGNKEKLFVFSGNFHSNSMHVYKTEISLGNLNISSPTEPFNSFPNKDNWFSYNNNYKLISSPNNNCHLFLFIDRETQKDSAILMTKMFNNNMDLLWENSFSVIDYNFVLYWTIFADDFGNMHAVIKDPIQKSLEPGVKEYKYFLTTFFADGSKVGPNELTLNQGRIYDYSIQFNKSNELIMSGLFYTGTIEVSNYANVIYSDGTYCMRINTLKGEIENLGQNLFTMDMVKAHTHLDYPKQEDYDKGILHYKTIKTVLREDGGIYTIIEYSVDYEEFSKLYDLAVISFNNNAMYEWDVSIPKRQRAEASGMNTDYWRTYGSFSTLYTNETLYVFFNDNIDNLPLTSSSEKVAKWKNVAGKDNIVCVATISTSGVLKKYILDKDIAVEGPPRIGAAVKLSDNKTLYVNLRKGLFERHGVISLK